MLLCWPVCKNYTKQNYKTILACMPFGLTAEAWPLRRYARAGRLRSHTPVKHRCFQLRDIASAIAFPTKGSLWKLFGRLCLMWSN